jgi:PAS domain S-box-containing protein
MDGPGTGVGGLRVVVVGSSAARGQRELDGVDGIDPAVATDVESALDAVLSGQAACAVVTGGDADLAAFDERRRERDAELPAVLWLEDPDAIPEPLVRDPFVECCSFATEPDYVASSVWTLVGHRRSVADRRRKERALDQAPVGITISDPTQPDNPVTYANEGFARLTGYPVAEVVGRNCRFLQGPDTDEETIDEVRAAVEADESVEVDLLNYRADGSTFWNHLDVSPVYDDQDRLVNYVGYQKDVTERVEQARRLREQNERLETLANVMSHDIRNPLSVAMGHVEAAVESGDPDWQAISESLQRIETIAADARALARDDPADAAAVDLETVARDAWAVVETGRMTLTVAESATIQADAGLLAQLFENLYRNVVEHASATTVTVGSLVDGFYVADDGLGIPAAEREQVFEGGYTTEDAGTGLGLSIVRRVADAHGWSVAVVEGDDGGARFEVRDVEGA